MTKHWIRLALAATTLAAAPTLLSPTLFAQAISVNGGSIQGVISDPSGRSCIWCLDLCDRNRHRI